MFFLPEAVISSHSILVILGGIAFAVFRFCLCCLQWGRMHSFTQDACKKTNSFLPQNFRKI